MKTVYVFFLIFFQSLLLMQGQNLTQLIRGRIVDKESQNPLPGATVVVENSNPFIGSITDENGNFCIKNVPLGRCNIKVSFMGYDQLVLNEIMVGSGKEVVLNIELKESIITTKEVVITINKREALNSMATVSTRQFSVEEASRYAGGFDDPARLASSFAGVSSNLGNNGIVVRGNAPKGLLWRMEGIEISNPSHFANMTSMGSGAVTALSSQVLANSDFYTGAFPAEYGNALSGVFDLKMRTGNNEKRENTVQIGLVGIDIASEGPFIKGKEASYLFNYRYSTFGLLAPILPKEMGKLKYQDLSFKINLPSKEAGTFSLWGIGALDFQGRDALTDSNKWTTDFDKQQYSTDLFMSAAGLNHKISIGKKTFIRSTLAASGNGLLLDQKNFDNSLNLNTTNKIKNNNWKYTFSGYVNHKFNAKLTNKTGIIVNRLQYDLLTKTILPEQNSLSTLVNTNNSSYLIQSYSQSKYDISKKVTFIMGLHSQYFLLNKHSTIEPRTGVTWNINNRNKLGFSYGLHSQLEMIGIYMVQHELTSGINLPNKNLDFSKAHHFVLSYEIKLSDYSHFKIEPYYQRLFNIPVIPNSYYSLQNIETGLYFNDSLVNKGKGKNIGIDFTWERFLNKGYYYLITTSIFDSKYSGGDNKIRNSRFNKNYVLNLLGGKEWSVGKEKNNIININGKFTLMGGDYMNPLNTEKTVAIKEIVYNENKAFTARKSDAKILSFSITYRINKEHHSSIWSFNYINILGYKEFNSYYFDKTTNTIKKDQNELVIPNISYKLEF